MLRRRGDQLNIVLVSQRVAFLKTATNSVMHERQLGKVRPSHRRGVCAVPNDRDVAEVERWTGGH